MKNPFSPFKRLPLAIVLTACTSGTMAQSPVLKITQLSAGAHMIHAEVAATEEQREQGLMYREKMAPHAGMLFVFDAAGRQCMWMKDTLLPLSVAFLDAAGKIVNIEDMQPQTFDSHCSTKGVPVRFALEMNQGWFRQKNVKPGMSIGNLPIPH